MRRAGPAAAPALALGLLAAAAAAAPLSSNGRAPSRTNDALANSTAPAPAVRQLQSGRPFIDGPDTGCDMTKVNGIIQDVVDPCNVSPPSPLLRPLRNRPYGRHATHPEHGGAMRAGFSRKGYVYRRGPDV